MARSELVTTLIELLEPLAESNDFELVAVEQTGGRNAVVLRVLLDREGGVGLEEICEANQWVSEALEQADPVSGPYVLEVSSPGIDRPLRTREHFVRFAGETVKVKTDAAGPSRSSWTGTLVGMDGDDVVLEVEGERVALPLSSVVKARLKGVVSFKQERGAS